MLSRASCVLAALILVTAHAFAAPTAVGKYKDWTVFTENVGGYKLCYAATQATDKAPKAAEHGDVWFFVSNWRSGAATNQPSLRVGYTLREDLPGKARIGRSTWSMFSTGPQAFTDNRDDAQLVRNVKSGSELRIEATSARNTRVTYHFSLAGSSSAIKRAADACK